MKAIVHIGLEKTGTTSIQRFLSDHRTTLAELGVLVPSALGPVPSRELVMMGVEPGTIERNHRMAGLTTPEAVAERIGSVTAALEREIEERDPSVLLLSNELLSNRLDSPERIARFSAWVRRFTDDTQVLVYLRRQDDMFLAMYSTLIKVGFSGPLELPPPPGEQVGQNIDKYDFHQLLGAWAAEFGHEGMTVRVFEPGRLIDGDLITDFCESAGIPDHQALKRPPRQNERLSADALEFLRRFNPHVPAMRDGVPNPARRGVVDALEDYSSKMPKPTWPDPAMRRDFLRRYDDSNAAVARRYLHDDSGRLFQPIEDEHVATEATGRPLDIDGAVRIAAALWESQHRRIAQSQRRQRRLRERVDAISKELSAQTPTTASERESDTVDGDYTAVRRVGRRLQRMMRRHFRLRS